MTRSKTSIAVALTSVLALAACEPGPIGGNPNDPNANTRNGALIGAGTGAVIGALSKGDGNRAQGALAGAVAGGALGAVCVRLYHSRRLSAESASGVAPQLWPDAGPPYLDGCRCVFRT